MKYSFKYISNKYDEKVDEYWIKFKPNYIALNTFIQGYHEKRIIIKIFEEELDNFDIDKIKDLFEVVFCVPYSEKGIKIFNTLKEKNIQVFFMDFVKTIEELKIFLNLGVSDVYVGGDLGFNLKEVSKLAHHKNVLVRCIPNIYQKDNEQEEEVYKGFFIRPEGVYGYEEYVDVMEFYIEKIEDGPWYYRVYAIEGRWFGNLQDIIYDLPEKIISYALLPIEESRARCKKKCNEDKCDICAAAIRCGNTMLKHELWLNYQKGEIDF